MTIITVRRISQIFFFILFIWLCIVATVGERFWQVRGWPVNLFLHLDPLTAIATMLSTRTLYAPLALALVPIFISIVFGRVFCGWFCPMGSAQQFVGWLGSRGRAVAARIKSNRYRPLQRAKYLILIVFLVAAVFPLSTASLQIGLLDPISLISRSVNSAVLPVVDRGLHITSVSGRFYEGGGMMAFLFIALLAGCLAIPRLYCRFLCPLGALLGILGRYSLFRIGHNQNRCTNCQKCVEYCEGACQPDAAIRTAECVLCMNCREHCGETVIDYSTLPSAAGEIASAGISRKGFLFSLAGGITLMPFIRLDGQLDANWFHRLIRPPGALDESGFLKRCVKCGECMRICPTNVLQPAGITGGIENLWTPVLNNRIGSSGCQFNCVACGQVCPTAAIRAITLDEKHGRGAYKQQGIVRIGTAFVDRNRCLPWAMDKPCIVCQENCPVSPKAIHTDEYFSTIRDGSMRVAAAQDHAIVLDAKAPIPSGATGDYYIKNRSGVRAGIRSVDDTRIQFDRKSGLRFAAGEALFIQVRLQRPYVDINRCSGCGICEHECPVSGLRAIRVSAVGETRSAERAMQLRGK